MTRFHMPDARALTLEESLALRVHAGYQPRKNWRTRAVCAAPGFQLENMHEHCPGCPVRLDCLATIMRDEQRCPLNYILDYVAISQTSRRRHRLPRLIVHGTPAGYKQHRDRGEDACARCKGAHAARPRPSRAKKAIA